MALEILSGKSKMPLVAEVLTAEDEDLIAQAQERERARLEEEALILAYQQQQQAEAIRLAEQQRLAPIRIDDAPAAPAIPVILNETPMGMIQDAPVAPPIPVSMLPERFSTGDYHVGSDQYMNEVARARRGSGFVNADVGPMGNVITPGYDPSLDPRAVAAEREAINFQRQQLYGQLLRDGSTAAEAYRFANSRYPDIKSAAGLIRAETALARTKPRPLETRTLNGQTYYATTGGGWAPVSTPGQKAPIVAPDTVASQKIISGQIVDKRKDLERARKEVEINPENVDAARRANLYQQQLTGLEEQYRQSSGSAPALPPVRTSGPDVNASPAPRPADPNAIRAAFRAGRLSRVDAEKQLKAIGFD